MSQRSGTEPGGPQVFRQLPWQRSQGQMTLFIAMFTVVGLIIGALYLAQATITANLGTRLLDLQRERERLVQLNQDIESQIAVEGNIVKLTERARALGFQPQGTDDLAWVVVNGFTRERATPTPLAPEENAPQYNETFEGWVQDTWNRLVRQFEQWAGNNRATTP